MHKYYARIRIKENVKTVWYHIRQMAKDTRNSHHPNNNHNLKKPKKKEKKTKQKMLNSL